MSRIRSDEPKRTARGSSPQERAQWRRTYARTPYDQLPWFSPGPSIGVERAVYERFLPESGDVLDVGCGAGSNLLFLAGRGFRVHGVDLSPGAVAATQSRAKTAGIAVDVREGDVLALPFPDRSMDVVVDNGCFHAIPIGRRPHYAREVARVLQPDGRFVLSWVAREHTAPMGPPHRPSVEEVTAILESRFLFAKTTFRPASSGVGPSVYYAFLVRRSSPYPPRR